EMRGLRPPLEHGTDRGRGVPGDPARDAPLPALGDRRGHRHRGRLHRRRARRVAIPVPPAAGRARRLVRLVHAALAAEGPAAGPEPADVELDAGITDSTSASPTRSARHPVLLATLGAPFDPE